MANLLGCSSRLRPPLLQGEEAGLHSSLFPSPFFLEPGPTKSFFVQYLAQKKPHGGINVQNAIVEKVTYKKRDNVIRLIVRIFPPSLEPLRPFCSNPHDSQGKQGPPICLKQKTRTIKRPGPFTLSWLLRLALMAVFPSLMNTMMTSRLPLFLFPSFLSVHATNSLSPVLQEYSPTSPQEPCIKRL